MRRVVGPTPTLLDLLYVRRALIHARARGKGFYKRVAKETGAKPQQIVVALDRVEQILKVDLFERGAKRRTARITPAGHLVVEQLREVLKCWNHMKRDARAVARSTATGGVATATTSEVGGAGVDGAAGENGGVAGASGLYTESDSAQGNCSAVGQPQKGR